MMDLEQIKQLDQKYYMPVFGERQPVCFTHGEGAKLYDTAGRQYTDFFAGIAVNALGYADAGFVKTVSEQAAKLVHTSSQFYNEPQATLARALCEKTGMGRVFFANSGAEANECAVKLAKMRAFKRGKKTAHFVALKNSFHGRTLLTLTATGQDKFHEPFEPGAYNWTYIDANDFEMAKNAINADTCAVIFEPVQGEGGVLPLSAEYMRHLASLCKQHGALLIADEIQTGMGRTGTFLAIEGAQVEADIVTLAKALGGGLPIGACLAKEETAAYFSPGDHGSTFGGGLLACAAANYVVGRMDGSMLARVRELGQYLKDALCALQDKLPSAIKEVRGAGLMLGMELMEGGKAAQVRGQLFQKGFIVGTAGANTLRLVPPYVISKADVNALLDALHKILMER